MENGTRITGSFTLAGLYMLQQKEAAILLLAEQGKLSLDDDIRKHLPELHDFGTPSLVNPFDRFGEHLLPDPASRAQPDGAFGPSQVVDPGAFRWTDAAWRGSNTWVSFYHPPRTYGVRTNVRF